jgi:hypothetical protein
MDGDEGVDDAAEDAVVAVDVFVRGVKGEGVGVEGFEGEEILDGELGDCDAAEAFGEVEVVCCELVVMLSMSNMRRCKDDV